ncbi:hypothetical protein GGH96_006096 [Coemansia sp. RSA 1972]|nr:hypothetical protein GGH96_006096 [Coemansia sp. RSA 1972]
MRNLNSPKIKHVDEYAEEKTLVEDYLLDDIDGLQSIAEHSDQTTQQFVTEQAESIAEFINELVRCAKPGLDEAKLENKLKFAIAAQLERRSPAGLHSKTTNADLLNSVKSFLPWLRPGCFSAFSKTNEKHVYPCFLSLINFVAELVVRPLLDQKPATPDQQPKRLVRSYELTDVKPDNSESGRRVDLALRCDALYYENLSDDDEYEEDSYQISEACLKAKGKWDNKRPNYPRIFAIVEFLVQQK